MLQFKTISSKPVMWFPNSLMQIRILDRPCEKNWSGPGSEKYQVFNPFFRLKIIMLYKMTYYALYEIIIYVQFHFLFPKTRYSGDFCRILCEFSMNFGRLLASYTWYGSGIRIHITLNLTTKCSYMIDTTYS